MAKANIISGFFLIVIFGCNQNISKKTTTNQEDKNVALTENQDSLFFKKYVENIEKTDLSITFQQYDGLAISFSRSNKDKPWSSISFGYWPYKIINPEEESKLHRYVKNLDFYWSYIEKSGTISLTRLGLLSPHSYTDVAINQVRAFNEDEQWKKDQNNVLTKKKNLMLSKTYRKAAEIMLKHDVYKPINDFIKGKGFSISGYDLEKVGEISEEEQKSMGIENPVLVPTPLAIIINVEKSKN